MIENWSILKTAVKMEVMVAFKLYYIHLKVLVQHLLNFR